MADAQQLHGDCLHGDFPNILVFVECMSLVPGYNLIPGSMDSEISTYTCRVEANSTGITLSVAWHKASPRGAIVCEVDDWSIGSCEQAAHRARFVSAVRGRFGNIVSRRTEQNVAEQVSTEERADTTSAFTKLSHIARAISYKDSRVAEYKGTQRPVQSFVRQLQSELVKQLGSAFTLATLEGLGFDPDRVPDASWWKGSALSLPAQKSSSWRDLLGFIDTVLLASKTVAHGTLREHFASGHPTLRVRDHVVFTHRVVTCCSTHPRTNLDRGICNSIADLGRLPELDKNKVRLFRGVGPISAEALLKQILFADYCVDSFPAGNDFGQALYLTKMPWVAEYFSQTSSARLDAGYVFVFDVTRSDLEQLPHCVVCDDKLVSVCSDCLRDSVSALLDLFSYLEGQMTKYNSVSNELEIWPNTHQLACFQSNVIELIFNSLSCIIEYSPV